MVETQKERYDREFIFLGANIDAIETAGRFGIRADRASNYVPDSEGTAKNFDEIDRLMCIFSREGSVPSDALDGIRTDVEKRGKK